MTCPKCGNEMRIYTTSKDEGDWHRKYLCDFCGKKETVEVLNPTR